MFLEARPELLLVVGLLFASAAGAQQDSPPKQSGHGTIILDVVASTKSGAPVTGLQQEDFTVLDNKVPQTITSFQVLGGSRAPIEVVLVVDAVNTGYEQVAYERDQIDKFLRVDEGRLAHPTTLAILTDTGMRMQEDFTMEGNALAASLDQQTVALRNIRRSAGFYGADERLQISLRGLGEIAAREAKRPGRKLILWVSPGWPFLSGPEVLLSNKDQEQIFADIVNISTQFLQSRITLYSVDPLGNADIGTRTFYYETFLKGVSKPSQTQPGDLGLQVLAAQSGGLVLNSNNDVSALLQKCIADTQTYYEIGFEASVAQRPNEYHHLEIRLAKHGLTLRTRDGYYAQP
jgi:VWFA-related protein